MPGATFDWQAIARKLETEPYEPDLEDRGREVRRVYLGTIFGLTPSGKYYQPFACSNVAGDCPACNGTGDRHSKISPRVVARAKARLERFAKRTIGRGTALSPAGKAYAERVQAFRGKAFAVTRKDCPACDGCGSISAARDARWTAQLEADAERIGAFVDYYDDGISIAQSRDASEESEESEEL